MIRKERPLFLLMILLASTFSRSTEPSQYHSREPDEVRVLMVGDSWSDYMWFDLTMRRLFALKGFPHILEEGGQTAISGSKAAEWTQPSMLQLITDELITFPTIDVVQLSIGGNDFLEGQPDGWYLGMTPEEESALFDRILLDIDTVVQHIFQVDPDMNIVIGGYDYPNFEDSRTGLGGLFCTPYWQDLGQPLPFDINTAMTTFEDMWSDYADTLPRLTYIRSLGTMQFVYGYEPLSIPPGALTPPGDLSLPSDMQAMRLGMDCFHLSTAGYDAFALNFWNGFYGSFFCSPFSSFLESLPTWNQENSVLELCRDINHLCP